MSILMCHLLRAVNYLLSLLVPHDNSFHIQVLCTNFDPSLFHNPDQEFDIDDAEAKLFALMKSPHTIDGCKLVRHQVDTATTCKGKRTWTFICSHGKVMRKIDDRHFGPDSVGKINVLYQNVKRTKSKGSIKGKFVLCFKLYMNSFMLL